SFLDIIQDDIPSTISDEEPQRLPFGGFPPEPPADDGNQDDGLQQGPPPQGGTGNHHHGPLSLPEKAQGAPQPGCHPHRPPHLLLENPGDHLHLPKGPDHQALPRDSLPSNLGFNVRYSSLFSIKDSNCYSSPALFCQ
uniref:Uncharacterized protein n=1 Tax=Piliocolobus tephrosceles TaxID=591936 RepID=A0A8C9LIW5_9PRIM